MNSVQSDLRQLSAGEERKIVRREETEETEEEAEEVEEEEVEREEE